MGYQKTEQGKETVFQCTPEAMPQKSGFMSLSYGLAWLIQTFGSYFGYIIISAIVAWLISMALFPLINGFGAIIGGVVGWIVLIRLIRKRRKTKPKTIHPDVMYREPARFSASPEGISLNGQLFPAKDIHRVLLRNHIEEMFNVSGSIRIVENTLSSQSREAGRQMAERWNRIRAQVSYRVEFEEGGRAHVLAGGLNETGANGLATDVKRALSL